MARGIKGILAGDDEANAICTLPFHHDSISEANVEANDSIHTINEEVFLRNKE